MATIINNPPTQAPAASEGGSMTGMLIAVGFIAVVGFLFFVYALPALRGNQSTDSTNSNPTITVPDTIDINIKK